MRIIDWRVKATKYFRLSQPHIHIYTYMWSYWVRTTSWYCKISLPFLLSLPLHPFLLRRPFCVFVARQRLPVPGDSPLWDKRRVISALQLGRSSKILAKISSWLHSRVMDFWGTNFAVRLLLMQFRSAFNRDMMEYHPTTQAKSGTGRVKSEKKKRL